MKKTLIVYAHPYAGSFNHAVLTAVRQTLEREKVTYDVIDLYQEQFNPIYTTHELKLFHTGQTDDPQVTAYLAKLRQANQIIFITPVWWNDLPAMLKGFIDKVMKEGPGLSHVVTKTGVKGLLTNLEQAYVLTTSTSPTFYLKLFGGNAIKRILIRQTLHQLGVKHGHWVNFGGITSSSLKRRQRYLAKVEQIFCGHGTDVR